MHKLEDVAKLAGLSVTTVSRVLNNRGYISQKTRDRVNEVIKELNYQPNEMARALFRKKSNMIGLIIPSVAHPFFSELSYYLEHYAHLNGYKLLVCNSNRDVEKESQYIDMLKKNQVDAIIMASSVLNDEHYQNLNLPVISFDRIISDTIPLIGANNKKGGKLAASLFIDKKCKNPAYLSRGLAGHEHEAMLANGRQIGFVERFKEVGINPIYFELNPFSNRDDRLKEIETFVLEHPDVDSIFASSDVIAAEILQVCAKLNKKVGSDILLIGYDDTSIATLVTPNLTTIRQPIQLMSESAINTIVNKLEGQEVTLNNIFDVELIERETT